MDCVSSRSCVSEGRVGDTPTPPCPQFFRDTHPIGSAVSSTSITLSRISIDTTGSAVGDARIVSPAALLPPHSVRSNYMSESFFLWKTDD